MVNILISGYYGFDNIGDESILRTLVSSLREHIPRLLAHSALAQSRLHARKVRR